MKTEIMWIHQAQTVTITSTYLEVTVVGCIMQGGVIIQALGVYLRPGSQELFCHIIVTSIACLMQGRPTYKQNKKQDLTILE